MVISKFSIKNFVLAESAQHNCIDMPSSSARICEFWNEHEKVDYIQRILLASVRASGVTPLCCKRKRAFIPLHGDHILARVMSLAGIFRADHLVQLPVNIMLPVFSAVEHYFPKVQPQFTVLQEVIAKSYETAVYEILGLQLQMKADQYFPVALFIFL